MKGNRTRSWVRLYVEIINMYNNEDTKIDFCGAFKEAMPYILCVIIGHILGK